MTRPCALAAAAVIAAHAAPAARAEDGASWIALGVRHRLDAVAHGQGRDMSRQTRQGPRRLVGPEGISGHRPARPRAARVRTAPADTADRAA